jgi:hypothetical protein
MKKVVRLNERDLANIVAKVIREEQKSKKNLNEGVLLTLGGLALGGAVIKKAYDYIKNRQLKNNMSETGNVKKSKDGKFTMKEYEDNSSGETFWGVDVTDHTRGEGYEERRVLLFKNDPERIEKILNSEVKHDYSDEAYMTDGYEDMFGQFKSDKRIDLDIED